MSEKQRSKPLPPGATAYNRRSLRIYDFLVHFLSDRFVWRCPATRLIDACRQNQTDNHLEIGVGSGKLLRKSAKGQSFKRLVIADVNQDCLDVAASNLKSFAPLSNWKLDLLDPDFETNAHSDFDSIGLNYVLHCLPLALNEKVELCSQLVRNCLRDGGVLFGSTLLWELNSNWFSTRLMHFYNRKQIMHNEGESYDLFQREMKNLEFDCELKTVGCVCLFRIFKS